MSSPLSSPLSASLPPPLGETIQALITKARIVSFSTWTTHYPASVITRFQAADDDRRYLTDDDLQIIEANLIEGNLGITPADNPSEITEFISIARQLRDQVAEIVDEARSQVLATFPNMTQPGGGLYPNERAEACWRDFWHFLRCITYGIAGHNSQYTSPDGLEAMRLLYQALNVPLDAMVVGLEGIKAASFKRIAVPQPDRLSPYFDHLITQLKSFTGFPTYSALRLNPE